MCGIDRISKYLETIDKKTEKEIYQILKKNEMKFKDIEVQMMKGCFWKMAVH